MTRPPSRWTHADVLAAVLAKESETDALDFKGTLYADTDDLVDDVASMANNGEGGVIVLGVEEDRNTRRAEKAVGVAVSEKATLRMTQAVAARLEPRTDWRIVPLEEAGQPSFYLLIIPPAPDGLHAVKRPKDTFQFLRRDGPGNRTMSVAEIAARFRNDKSVLDRIPELRQRSVKSIPNPVAAGGWLVLTTIPRGPSHWTIDGKTLPSLEAEWRDFTRRGGAWDLHPSQVSAAMVGQDRVAVRNVADIIGTNFELLPDGSSVLSCATRIPEGRASYVSPWLLIRRVAYLVDLAHEHAERAGSRGRLQMALQFTPPARALLVVNEYPGHQVAWNGGETAEVYWTADPNGNRLVTVRQLLSGVFHLFGLPEVELITPDGRLSRHWATGNADYWPAEVWANRET